MGIPDAKVILIDCDKKLLGGGERFCSIHSKNLNVGQSLFTKPISLLQPK